MLSPSSQGTDDQEKKAHLALLKKYSKPGVTYISPDAGQSSTDSSAEDTTTTTPQVQVTPVSPPASPAPAPRATTPTTTPSVLAPDPNDLTQSDISDNGGGGAVATPPVPYDEYTRALSAAQLSDPWNLSDQQLLDGMMGMLDENQRNTFQNMWATMTPDEQEQWLYQLRGMLAP